MPTIHRAQCEACGYATDMHSDYAAALIDRPPTEMESAVPLPNSTAPGSPSPNVHLLTLPHPLETSVLETAGYTWEQAEEEGRLVYVANVLCADCGTLRERWSLREPIHFGCATILLPMLMIMCLPLMFFHALLGVSVVGFLLGLQGLEALRERSDTARFRRRFADRMRWLESGVACPACGSTKGTGFDTSDALPCPSCKAKALKTQVVGMS